MLIPLSTHHDCTFHPHNCYPIVTVLTQLKFEAPIQSDLALAYFIPNALLNARRMGPSVRFPVWGKALSARVLLWLCLWPSIWTRSCYLFALRQHHRVYSVRATRPACIQVCTLASCPFSGGPELFTPTPSDMEPVLGNALGLRALSFRIHRWPRVQHYGRSNPIYMPERGYKSRSSNVSSLVSDPRRCTEMFNNSTGQPQPQITSASHDSSNRSSRTPNETLSSRSALELEATLHEDLLTDSRNQGHGQSLGVSAGQHEVIGFDH
ncbi:hypothetical protein EDB89DRAFT_1619413 [Lactarius sanguifluus]|nr:hypothetical protein EDB89DRAFT_1619413 [Lactarius sanguifluus]